MFRAAIDELFKNQLSRISKAVDPEVFNAAQECLEDNNLLAEDIDRECMKELSIILNKKYDIEVASGRLDNYGWSTAHIRDHMGRFLQSKMKAVGNILKAYVNEGLDADIEGALRDVAKARRPVGDDELKDSQDLQDDSPDDTTHHLQSNLGQLVED
jgi:hypothetical protein